ncbi:glycosyltransferase family 2 protein [Cerasicoccus maritimus]|uniref:glycosyltransferase family 2 protein n=1 Tax=Cerasicoccus maritimus TaxID=490089 RepID=UPI0028528BCB|nr:glycosyltransferase family 2 protein [Cerasicoccus maritimus]
MTESASHVLVIPSYNTGPILERTIAEAIQVWRPVWLFIDGSTDGAHEVFLKEPEQYPGLRVFVSKENRGKGATALWAAEEARKAGFTHMLLMDADGQHPADRVADFMEESARRPGATIMGQPDFGPDAPFIRLAGRQLSIGLTQLETLWGGIADPLFGFRVFPVEPLIEAFAQTPSGRRYDFDPEAAVRLFWAGVQPIKRTAAVRYVTKEEGGVSHFHYLRDNLTMICLHTRLLAAFLPRCFRIAQLSRKWRRLAAGDSSSA